ncbi:MAG: UDP-glucose/GDP-mannose dehydrogenase family protein [archaeon]|nr:UDP-glucose/GDP-mannose dehydrogenase family protein [archaeon]
MNPEFLREGSARKDNLKPDRIIIGEYDKASGDMLEKLYEEFYGHKMPPLIRTNLTTAELIKYTNNAFLATKVSFINSIANLCQKIPDADVKVVAESIGLDRRIGRLFLNAGLGWGGSCFLKDLRALTAHVKGLDTELPIIEASMKVNEDQPLIAISLAHNLVGKLKRKRVSVLGLSFKPNTDDMREAVSVKVINALLKEGAYVVVHDPRALENAKKIFGDKVRYEERVRDCLMDSECCIIVTEWDEYKALKPNDFQRYMKNPAVVDGRRIYNPEEFKLIKYTAVGLGS